jgi:hypothetical protein
LHHPQEAELVVARGSELSDAQREFMISCDNVSASIYDSIYTSRLREERSVDAPASVPTSGSKTATHSRK